MRKKPTITITMQHYSDCLKAIGATLKWIEHKEELRNEDFVQKSIIAAKGMKQIERPLFSWRMIK